MSVSKARLQILPAQRFERGIKPSNLESLRALDHRVVISDSDIARARQRVVSPANREKLFRHLKAFVLSAHDVDKTLREKWGIPRTIAKINIFIRSSGNGAYARPDSIEVKIGSPGRCDGFFASPASLYAHEQAHILAMFNEKGRCDFDPKYYYKKDLLGPDGKLKRKYFNDIPFDLFPEKMLFTGPRESWDLMFTLNELIANKAALQLSGYDEMTKFEKWFLSIWNPDDWYIPLEHLYKAFMAREFRLPKRSIWLRALTRRTDLPWKQDISTNELLARLSQFFNQVSLKRQA